MPDCEICSHQTHEAGRCNKCNCGQSEIVQHCSYRGTMRNGGFDDYITKIYITTASQTIYGERHYHCQ